MVASVGNRFLARLVDLVLQIAVGVAFLVAFDGWWVPYLNWVVGLAYEIVAIGAFEGRTVGKALLKVRVVDARTAAPPSWGQAVVRAWPMLLSRVPIVGLVAPVAYLRVLWDPERRGWHDLPAGTRVVASPPASA